VPRPAATVCGQHQLRAGVAWRAALRVHEWHEPAVVSPRALLADQCAQVYCVDSLLRDRRGRPYMVGHLRDTRMATEILDRLRFTYVFENWYP
jgi:hypothetical protein